MKKGFSGIVLSLLLALAMGTTVYADTFPSPGNTTGLDKVAEEWNSKIDDNITVMNENNVSVAVKKEKPTAAQVTEANEEVQKIGNAEIIGMADLSVSDNSAISSKGLTVTLKIPGVKPTDKIYVLHKVQSGWERLKATVGDGTVTCTMYSFSPVAVIRYNGDGELSVSDPSQNTGSNGTNNSGNTENNNNNTQDNNQSNSQQNNNNQSNSQSNPQNNSQNNPVSVNQNVTVNYPKDDKKGTSTQTAPQGGYVKPTGTVSVVGNQVSYATAPKTGESMPVLPLLLAAVLTGGISACVKKTKSY